MKCPYCGIELILKTREAYKQFWICSNTLCKIVSVIVTTTDKEPFKDETT